ncbi:flagellar protein FliO/FliZ [Luteimonas cucumeris]|uniref:Flagellar protein FliO/FliZ n=1 Tax=Luteimonas cucumeris TaxID=985012 RepID=A0A562KVF3_9GAMM|nr:flagellar biosynthetic protein FliO [Luteimonas cucumeris]TWH99399.1 flagellar protein FliO/FliZ [Luteimonas cucumeris]
MTSSFIFRRVLPGIACLAWTGLAWATAPAATATKPSFAGELLAIVLPLAAVVVGLFVVLHFARRRYGITGRDASLSIVQVLPVGPRERIVLVRTRAGRVFAVGVGAQSLSLITQLQPDDIAPPAENVKS